MRQHSSTFLLYMVAFFLSVISLALPLYNVTIADVNILNISTSSTSVNFYALGSVTSGGIDLFGYTGFQPLTNVPSALIMPMVVFLMMTLFTAGMLTVRVFTLRRKERTSNLDALGLAAFLMSLATPLVFLFTFEPAVRSSFGSYGYSSFYLTQYNSDAQMTSLAIGASSGVQIGWFLQLIAAGLIFFGLIAYWNAGPATSSCSRVADHADNAPVQVMELRTNGNSRVAVPKLHCGNCDKTIPLDARVCPYCVFEVKR